MAMTATTAGAAGARSAAVAAARSRRRVGTRRSGRAHQAGNFFRSAFRTGRFRRRENERFEDRVATLALVFVNRHWAWTSFLNLNQRKRNAFDRRPEKTNASRRSGRQKTSARTFRCGKSEPTFVKVGVRRERSALGVRSSGQTTCGTTTVDGRAARTGLFASRR